MYDIIPALLELQKRVQLTKFVEAEFSVVLTVSHIFTTKAINTHKIMEFNEYYSRSGSCKLRYGTAQM